MKHVEAILSRKTPDGWRWFGLQRLDDGNLLVTGGVPIGFITRGPRKGRPKWDRNSSTRFVVTMDELSAEEARFEREEGKCFECYGDGKVFASWSKDIGRATIACQRCAGTGAAKETWG